MLKTKTWLSRPDEPCIVEHKREIDKLTAGSIASPVLLREARSGCRDNIVWSVSARAGSFWKRDVIYTTVPFFNICITLGNKGISFRYVSEIKFSPLIQLITILLPLPYSLTGR